MRVYEKYKDSGVDWIGRVPEGWEIMKLKYATKNLDNLREPISAEIRERNNPIYYYYGASGIIDKIDYYNVDDTVLLIGEDGANLITRNLPLVYKANGKFWVNNHAHILKTKQNNYAYMAFLLECVDYTTFITGSAQPKLSQENLDRVLLPIPPLPEQRAIAAYLDRKTAQIDGMIAKREKQIELLEEMKTAIISQAVTKGLDPKVKMKDSGVEWIGRIPEGWEMHRLKTDTFLKGRIGWNGLRADEFKETSFAYLVTGQDFKGPDICWKECYQIDKERYDEDPFIQLNNGDLLITKDGTIGKIAKVTNMDKPACLNSGVFVMKQKNGTYIQGYLYWMLCSNMFYEFNSYTSTGTTILHLYQNVFERMPLLVPPLPEQRAIAAYLDRETSRIDARMAKHGKQVELLKEYKTTLISNVVTGKIKVTE